jgi:hypothetical protein
MAKRHQALEIARKELGVTENPRGSNWGPRVSQYLKSAGILFPAPWCMAFVHWAFERAGVHLSGAASVQRFHDWANKNGYIVKRPFKGDVVCYDWNADNWDDHVGFVDRVLAIRWRGNAFAGWVKTIEGNTAVGNDSNGGKVMVRYRWIKKAVFVRIPD